MQSLWGGKEDFSQVCKEGEMSLDNLVYSCCG